MNNFSLSGELKKTPFHALHDNAGAKMVTFAGYEMPIQYPKGIMGEHLHTRTAAGLFDVSHMGHIRLHGLDMIQKLEGLVTADLQELKIGQIKYALLTNSDGGVIDDLMITREENGLYLIVNASRKHIDLAHLHNHLGRDSVEHLPDRALLALQGPAAASVLGQFVPEITKLPFMHAWYGNIGGLDAQISRSGYTGEDGYEMTVRPGDAAAWIQKLLGDSRVQWAGLGARDTLRLEAALCLYGQELTETITPVEADLKWAIGKRHKTDVKFLGGDKIRQQLQGGPPKLRVGIKMDGRQIARGHTIMQNTDGKVIGEVTSGTFSPSLQLPIAMGYVDSAYAKLGTAVMAVVRDQPVPATVAPLPFVPYKYYRSPSS
jgi:aminomethyltransferase